MRVLLLTAGSQGDVLPFAALGARLAAAGHDAVLAAPALFGGLAAACGVPFVPFELDVGQVGEALAGRHGLAHLVTFCRAMGRRVPGVLPGVTQAARPGADVVVHHPVLPLGQHCAELLGVPAVVAQPLPALVATRQFASAAWPGPVPGPLNRTSYHAVRVLAGAWCRRDIDRWRRDVLALPARPGRHDPLRSGGAPVTVPPARPGRDDPLRSGRGASVTVLHAYSPHVVPRPADWPATAHVTGYWTLPSGPDWVPPRRLAQFLDDPEPAVYLGFGSMPGPDPRRLADAIMAAARQSGVRVLVGSVSPDLRRLLPSGRFLVIRHAPHDWLFPRVQAIVHHGGAGTTGAAVAAGRPQVIWPFGVDQPFWSRRMADLGVAPPARPVRALTGATLAAALGRVLGDEQMRARAAELGRRVRAEDGCGRAIDLLMGITAGTPLAVPA
jgi:sterol 3beta-glucosyltransferase